MSKRKKIIVVGGGFAGVNFIKKVDTDLFDVLLIDKINHYQFQPLFYQVATSQIEPSNISFPLRNLFKSKKNLQIRLAEVQKVIKTENKILTDIGEFDYDYLVLAIGCKTNFFGNEKIQEFSYTLKSTYEAIAIRNHILQNFEDIISANENDLEPLLNLVIVGAGPTGVELAGSFAEIKLNVLPKDYPGINFSKFKITVIEGSKNTLNNMSDKAKKTSKKYLKSLGVAILTETYVKDYDGTTLTLSNGQIMQAKTVIWAAGVIGNKLEGFSEDDLTPGNRFKVNRINKVTNSSNIFAVGDIAFMETPKYPKGHPQVANVANNQAKLLAKNLKAIALNKTPDEFEYKDLGSMATIGRNKAVVDFPFMYLQGYFAWLIWMFLHLMLILSGKNKILIFINWTWNYFSKDSSLRLILSRKKQ